MKAISIILGILLIFCGISAMCTPFATFLSVGYLIGIMMFVYGIMGIIKTFQRKSDVFQTVMSVLAVVVGIVSFARPGSILIFDGMLLYMVAGWFLLRGIAAIVIAFQVKGLLKGWYWGLIIGILSVILGIYSFAHPVFTALTTGILAGLYFVETGIDMIVFATAMGSPEE